MFGLGEITKLERNLKKETDLSVNQQPALGNMVGNFWWFERDNKPHITHNRGRHTHSLSRFYTQCDVNRLLARGQKFFCP